MTAFEHGNVPAFLRPAGSALEKNRENLARILKDNADTIYGKRYHFDSIADAEDYRKRLPLTRYEDYDEICGQGNYTSYPINCYLETSGTTGGHKLFPLTVEALERYGTHFCDIPRYLWGGDEGPHLHASVLRIEKDGIINLSSAHYRWLLEHQQWDVSSYLGGKELMFLGEVSNVPYMKLWLALSCPSLLSIQSVFLYDVLCMMNYLEKNWQSIIKDMQDGVIRVEINEAVENRLLELIPDAGVLEWEKSVLEEGFDTPIIPRLWKDIRFISGIGGSSLDFQTEALRRYCGSIPISYLVYGSSECLMGIAPYADRAEYMLHSDTAYYEFMDEQGSWTDIDKLEIGKSYEPVITTFSGLYRYRTSDLIRILSYQDSIPVFEVLGRKNTFNITGEKMSETTAKLAVRKWVEACKIHFFDYTMGVAYESIPGYYLLFVEEPDRIPENAIEALDDILVELSMDYAIERQHGRLDMVKIYTCGKGEISEMISFDKGHRKHHVFLTHAQTARLLEVSREM